MIKQLIKLADSLDAEGKYKLAEEVDKIISMATRKKAPLKHLDENVKKNLIGFTHKVEKNLKDSVESLEELSRRLRYFDLAHLIKETALDKAINEMKNTSDCVDSASKKMYELSYGRRPTKDAIEQMLADGDETSDSLIFFESQTEPKESGLEETPGSESEDEAYEADESDIEEMLAGFWNEEE